MAAIVAVLGLSSSSQAGLLAEIGQLGTNLLEVTNGQTAFGQTAQLPEGGTADDRPHRAGDRDAVHRDHQRVGLPQPRHPVGQHERAQRGRIEPQPAQGGRDNACTPGTYLNAASAHEPVCVLGAAAAQHLGIDRVFPGERIWVGKQWFYVVGILNPAVLTPEIDSEVLVGFPAAEKYLGYDGHPSTIYVRTNPNEVTTVYNVLGATANPENPGNVDVSQPSNVLVAQADAKDTFNDLFLGLGAVALLVGAVGVANIMVISVLERRSEIGLRRSLGATKGHIRTQFLSEAILLSILGGLVGVGAGALATVVYASTKGWTVDVPPLAWAGGFAAALVDRGGRRSAAGAAGGPALPHRRPAHRLSRNGHRGGGGP